MSIADKDYLALYDKTAQSDQFPLIIKWMATEPLAFFKQLREQRPILVTPGCTIISRYVDVIDILSMPTIFTVGLYKPKMGDYLMTHDNDAIHSREKSIMKSLLNRDDLPFVRKIVERNASRTLDEAKGNIEVVNDYCRAVPASLVQDYFGIDGVDPKDLIEWSYWNQYDAFHNQPFDLISDEKRKFIIKKHDEATAAFTKFMTGLIARRLLAVKAEQATNIIFGLWHLLKKLIQSMMGKKPYELKDDVLTRMVRTSYPDAVNFPIERLGLNAGGLLVGAVETTSQAVVQVIQKFMKEPDIFVKAKAAAQLENTDQFDGFVWEALRFVPIAPFVFRDAAIEYTVAKGTDHETTISQGDYLIVATQSAMFDTYAFEDPDAFIPGRNWYHNFNFGFGSHECLGKHVGMVMIPEMVRQVILRTDLKADGDINFKDGPFPEEYNLSWT